MSADRERSVSAAFVSIANSLADGYDAVDLFSGLTTHCAELLDVSSAGLLLADARGVLHVMAASSDATRDLESFQLQRDEGPCLDCYCGGSPVLVPDLSAESARWPVFVPAALGVGFAAVHAVPMRLRDVVLGALGLFSTNTGALNADDLDLAQALAHVASIALVADKALSDKAAINEQLQHALASRVILEQAKGVLAERGGLEMGEAFAALRRYSRDHNQKLSKVAHLLVSRELPATEVLDHADQRSVKPTVS
ncbi:MAG TPA: GAF and ANTAR domain-containing protein [Sporichthya sp.]|nr:GAF and ANTAR domain-containing protein [Sporichthya sp.]